MDLQTNYETHGKELIKSTIVLVELQFMQSRRQNTRWTQISNTS